MISSDLPTRCNVWIWRGGIGEGLLIPRRISITVIWSVIPRTFFESGKRMGQKEYSRRIQVKEEEEENGEEPQWRMIFWRKIVSTRISKGIRRSRTRNLSNGMHTVNEITSSIIHIFNISINIFLMIRLHISVSTSL